MPRQKKPAPLWAVMRIKRADAGGVLYNAVHVTSGREYWGVPSYNRAAIEGRVAFLNRAKPAVARYKAANVIRAIEAIFELYDGKEVDSETHSRVTEILSDVGYYVRDPNDVETCKECGRLVDDNGPLAFVGHARSCSMYRE